MVLNGRVEGTVSAANQKRVLDAAAELGYTRSALAISLKERRTRTIGLITDEIATSPFAGRMARAASMAAAREEYMVITMDLSLRENSFDDAAKLLAERQVDGLIYATMGRVRVPMPKVPPGVPLVLLNCEIDDPEVPETSHPATFLPDDYGGARRAARRLVETGHRRIVMLSDDEGADAGREREAGFRGELIAHGIEPRIIPAGWQMNDGYRVTTQLLSEAEPPTGLFCIRDRVAGGALHAAAAAGVDVPRDLSVIGFDDEDFFADRLTPGLTTIALPHMEMGEQAMIALLALLEQSGSGESERRDAADGPSAETRRTVIACPLVERDSVGIAPEQ